MTKTTSPIEFARPATDFEVMQQEHIEQLKAELAEARADADHWKSECNTLQRMVHEARAEIKLKNEELGMFLAEQQAMGEIIESKNKLIEQMREALQWYKEQVSSCNRNGDVGELARDRLAKDVGKRAEAALLAAERGE